MKVAKWREVLWVVPIVVGLVLVAMTCQRVGDSLEDDPLISLRYSERLLEGKGLTWTDGERVEGYSNLSQVVIVAALGLTGLDLIVALRVFTIASTVLTFIALALFLRRLGAGVFGTTVALVLLGNQASTGVWAIGGLEQPFLAACLATALWSLAESAHHGFRPSRWSWLTALSLSFLVWSRPDSPLFVAFFCFGLIALHGRTHLAELPRSLIIIIGTPTAAWAAQLIFRLAYYGEWVPNTALIKARTSEARMCAGLDYVKTGLTAGALITSLTLIALVIAMISPRTRRWALMLIAMIVSWFAYLVIIGGDHFAAWRHLVVVWTLAVAMVGLGFVALNQRTRRVAPIVLAATLFALSWSTERQWQRWDVAVAHVRRWPWDGIAVGATFGKTFAREQPLHAVTAAGCMPYGSKLPSLDMLGLNDKHIARQPPDPRGSVGHDHGDGEYVLRRAPDLISFSGPAGGPPSYLGGAQMQANPSFAADYALVRFLILEPVVLITDTYVRTSGRVGVRSLENGSIEIPAYLFTHAHGLPIPDGRMGAMLEANQPATFPVPKGEWSITLSPPNPRVAARINGSAVELTAEFSSVVGSVILTPGEAIVAEPAISFRDENQIDLVGDGYAAWKRSGVTFVREPSNGPRNRQGPISGTTSDRLNSYHFEHGDDATGSIESPPFVAESSTVLEFKVGGGSAIGTPDQDGVRVIELLPDGTRRTHYAIGGQRDEVLRPVVLDLGWLVGRTLVIEVFDESVIGWGHVLASDFRLLH